MHFYLKVPDVPVAIAGDYTLTFIADGACANLPDELRTRSYAATVGPADFYWPGYPADSGTSFKVTPAGSAFPRGLNNFYLNVAGNYIAVSLGTTPTLASPNASHQTHFLRSAAGLDLRGNTGVHNLYAFSGLD